MKYVVLVSHGHFAKGLKNALTMLGGQRDDLLAEGLEDGQTQEAFSIQFADSMAHLQSDDEIILLGDLIGGSPLTTAVNILTEKEMKFVVIGGMNLPLALTLLLMKDAMPLEDVMNQAIQEAKEAVREFKVVVDEEDDI